MFLLIFSESKYFKTDARRSFLSYNPCMRIYWILAILLIMVSCGEKSAEQSGSQNPTQVGKPPVSIDPDSSSSDEPVSIFETEEFKNSLRQAQLKERILHDRGYRMNKNEDGTYSWKEYFYKNELGGTLKWQEGVFVTKYRTKVGGPTHDLVTGEELPLFSEEISLYHTEPVFEFLSVDNWPKLEKFLGEAQDAIAAHYNKYMNALDDKAKLDLEAKYAQIAAGYNNAKGHVEYLSLPVMTWEEIYNKFGTRLLIYIDDKTVNLISLLPELINNSEIGRRYKEEGKVVSLRNKPQDYFPSNKKFKVYSDIITLIQ